MSDAGDEIKVDEVEAEPEVAEAPKGKLSVEDALQVGLINNIGMLCTNNFCSKF